MKPQIEDENGEVWDIEDISTLLNDIKNLKQQNAELTAYTEEVKTFLYIVHASDSTDNLYRQAIDLATKTPRQSLANIKADAINTLINQPFVKYYQLEDDETQYIIEGEKFDNYANQLREESK
ncbi:hypothetical protein THIOSC15_2930022 [uncultured Thiomicrorhabdus sp.]